MPHPSKSRKIFKTFDLGLDLSNYRSLTQIQGKFYPTLSFYPACQEVWRLVSS